MKKLRIYMQYPLFRSDSQYYKSILDNPPKDVKFVSGKRDVGMITDKKKFGRSKFLKKSIRILFNWTGFPFPSAFYVRNAGDYDLIHCAHCLCLNRIPWVVDIEFVSQLWGGTKKSWLRKYFVRRLLMSRHCKKILAWTEESRDGILREFPEVEDKVDILRFASVLSKARKIDDDIVTLLFIGRYFYGKGGLDALETFDILTKKYDNVRAIFISEIPDGVGEKYYSNEKIEFSDLIPFEKLINGVYPRTDVYVCPGYSDSFGFPFVEAQSFGIPVVTVDGPSRREVVEDGVTGFVISKNRDVDFYEVNEKIVEKIIERVSELVEDDELRRRMGEAGRRVVKDGRFSVGKRNKKLLKVYREAAK